jgi:hypothetical protein
MVRKPGFTSLFPGDSPAKPNFTLALAPFRTFGVMLRTCAYLLRWMRGIKGLDEVVLVLVSAEYVPLSDYAQVRSRYSTYYVQVPAPDLGMSFVEN